MTIHDHSQMTQFEERHLNEATQNATNYTEFRNYLKKCGYRMPFALKPNQFPYRMKGWVRKLRYEFKEDYQITTGKTTGHDRRQIEYYDRLARLGHPNPELLIAQQT